jgi:RNA polymerase sigma factor (sigma-70 family)
METENSNIQLVDFELGLMKFTHSLNIDNEDRDLVRETLHNAIINRPKYKINGHLHNWTEAMIRKAFVNNYKRIVLQDQSDKNISDLFLISQDESEYNQEVLFNNIIRNIEQLNYRLVQPFKLFVEGYSYKEIARKLNLKIETVTKRIFIARYQLMLQDI